MWYNTLVTRSDYGALFVSCADGSDNHFCWVKHPVLLDIRLADRVTTSASNTGCFAMTLRDGNPCGKCGGVEWDSEGYCAACKRERQRRYRQTAKSKARHDRYNSTEKSKARHDRYNSTGKRKAVRQKRRARESGAGGAFTAPEWRDLCKLYGGRCAKCGKKTKLEADHVIPISKGGSSDISNIQPLCRSCNASKYTSSTDYRHKGGVRGWIQRNLFGDEGAG